MWQCPVGVSGQPSQHFDSARSFVLNRQRIPASLLSVSLLLSPVPYCGSCRSAPVQTGMQRLVGVGHRAPLALNNRPLTVIPRFLTSATRKHGLVQNCRRALTLYLNTSQIMPPFHLNCCCRAPAIGSTIRLRATVQAAHITAAVCGVCSWCSTQQQQ